jgi:hypothetical protein
VKRFNRLPALVDAIQFDRSVGYVAALETFCPGCRVGPAHVTLPNGLRAEMGWWIVRDGLGLYTTFPDLAFRAQFEPAQPA